MTTAENSTQAAGQSSGIELTPKGESYVGRSLSELMDAMKERNAEHGRCIDAVDAHLAAGGAPQELWDAQSAACDAADAAALAIISYRPRTIQEQTEKVAFLREWWVQCQPEAVEIEALLDALEPEDVA